MTTHTYSRREFLTTSTTAVAGYSILTNVSLFAQTTAQPNSHRGSGTVRVISSANGKESAKRAFEMVTEGVDTLDAVIGAVNIVEDNPEDTSVGLGGLPNEDGVVELDAAVMHGPSHKAGAVAALRNIRNPSKVAKLVMEQSDHVLLVGEGALRFAKAHGFREEDLLTEKARKIWLYWKQSLSEKDDWIPPPDDQLDPDVARRFGRSPGTIHCAAINKNGDMSCVTTTSGLSFKIPGRVGDSPIIGAGLYVDNAIGTCGSTGRGEANLQNLCSFAAVELMGRGMSPKDAGMKILRRVIKHTTEPRLLKEEGVPNFNLRFYLLSKSGDYAGVSMKGPVKFAISDDKGTRLEDCEYLFEKE